jgi:hypothetical protein
MSEGKPEPGNEQQDKNDGGLQGGAKPSPTEDENLESTAPRPARPAKPGRRVRNPIESEEYFGVQYSRTSELPDPVESLKALATGVVEVIAGTRQVDQLARWLTDDVYQRLQFRARRAEAQRVEQGVKAHYQNLSVGGLRTSSPRDGVIESVILLSSKSRTRAVTIRLEGINARWRATSVSVL